MELMFQRNHTEITDSRLITDMMIVKRDTLNLIMLSQMMARFIFHLTLTM